MFQVRYGQLSTRIWWGDLVEILNESGLYWEWSGPMEDEIFIKGMEQDITLQVRI